MKRQFFFPRTQEARPDWFGTYAQQLNLLGTGLNLVPEDFASSVMDGLYLEYVSGLWLKAVREFGPACTSALDVLYDQDGNDPFVLPVFTAPGLPPANAPLPAVVAVRPGALQRIFAYVQVIKAMPLYTDAIGLQMGIVGPEETPTPDSAGPEFTLKVEQGDTCQVVRIRFKKKGRMAVAIYSRRAGGEWVLLGIATSSPYLDDRPLANSAQPEVREYRLRFWDDGSETGEWSAVDKVTVAP
jgi:hypothetical protein